MNKKNDNRRKFHRIDFNGRVIVDFPDNGCYDQCRATNLSLTGLFVKGKFNKQRDKSCNIILFDTEGPESGKIQACAKVVWSNEDGAGIEFTSMSQDSYMTLLSTLISNADIPAVILYQFPTSNPFEITGSQSAPLM